MRSKSHLKKHTDKPVPELLHDSHVKTWASSCTHAYIDHVCRRNKRIARARAGRQRHAMWDQRRLDL